MNRRTLLSLVLLPALIAACGGGEPEPATDSGAESAAAGAPQEAVGRCAVDARDGAPYGRITGDEVDASTGERMYRIEGEGGTQWNKKAGNVRVVDCPS